MGLCGAVYAYSLGDSVMEQEQKRTLAREDYSFFFSELNRISATGLISTETLNAIGEYYEPKAKPISFRKLLVLSCLLLGVVALGFALFITLDKYWETLGEAFKTALVITPFVTSYVGYFVSTKHKRQLASQVFLFAGCSFFFLLAAYMFSTYADRLDEYEPLLYSASVTTFAAAFCSRNQALHGLVVFYIGALLFLSSDYSSSALFGDQGYFCVLPMIGLGLYWSYRQASGVVGMAYYLLFAFWATLQFWFWDVDVERYLPFPIVIMYSALALFGLYCRRAGIFRGGLPVLAYLIVLTALPFLTEKKFYTRGVHGVLFSWSDYYILVGIGTAIGVLSSALLYRIRSRADAPAGRPVLNALLALTSPEGVGLATLPLFVVFAVCYGLAPTLAPIFAFYANVLMVGVAARFIWIGAKGSPFQFWIGVVYFIVWMFLRMTSLISTFNADEKTFIAIIFFLVVAAALFAASYCFKRFVKTEPETHEIIEKPEPRKPEDFFSERARQIAVVVVILLQFAVAFAAPFC